MFGAIAGDVIGSIYERRLIKTTDFPLLQPHCHFTDDTVMTIAIAQAILDKVDYALALKEYGRRYPRAGYGKAFIRWIFEEEVLTYQSWGNGSAMRASPIGFAFESMDEVLLEARRSAEVSHDHPEGIKGAQATALAVFLARSGVNKAEIRSEISTRFDYDLSGTVEQVRETYRFDVSCQGSVPQAILAFLDSTEYEGAVRLAISLGGDSDTLACIAGGIAQAYYQSIPQEIVEAVRQRLPEDMLDILDRFDQRFGLRY